MSNKHMKRGSTTSCVIGETSFNHKETPLHTDENGDRADGDGRAVGTRTRCWWGCNVAQPLRKMGASLTKLDTTVLYKPATVRLGTYPKNMRT